MIMMFILFFVYKVNHIILTSYKYKNENAMLTANSQNVLRIYKSKVTSLRILLMVVGVTFR